MLGSSPFLPVEWVHPLWLWHHAWQSGHLQHAGCRLLSTSRPLLACPSTEGHCHSALSTHIASQLCCDDMPAFMFKHGWSCTLDCNIYKHLLTNEVQGSTLGPICCCYNTLMIWHYQPHCVPFYSLVMSNVSRKLKSHNDSGVLHKLY